MFALAAGKARTGTALGNPGERLREAAERVACLVLIGLGLFLLAEHLPT